MGERQQAYDRGSTIFSPDGRLYQVEYAREAVENGEPVVGVCGDETVALAAFRPTRSSLVDAGSIEKLHGVDDRIAVANAGHAADGHRLVDIARRAAQRERLRFGEATAVTHLAQVIADHIQEHTQTGGSRPYGTALLMAGVDERPSLVEIDPSGATRSWQADAVGRGATDIIHCFEDRYEPDLSGRDTLALALEGLTAELDDPVPADLDAMVVHPDRIESVADDEIATLLDAE